MMRNVKILLLGLFLVLSQRLAAQSEPPVCHWDAAGDDIFNLNNGNVGIGTSSPDANLDIEASGPTIRFTNTGAGGGIWEIFKNPNTGRLVFTDDPNNTRTPVVFGPGADHNLLRVGFVAVDRVNINGELVVNGVVQSSLGGFKFPDSTIQATASSGDGHSLDAANGSQTDVVFVDNNGNVGVGTTAPSGFKLAVAGEVIAEGVTVKLQANWPDFVFADGYELMPLDEVEAAIREEGHLPGIPSAAEVAEDGVDLGEMQAQFLQKIEELTLHMIALKKDNDELRSHLEHIEDGR